MAEILIFLIWLAVYAIGIYIVIWAITTIASAFGFGIPAPVVKLFYVIGVLILLWYVVVYFPVGMPGFPHRQR